MLLGKILTFPSLVLVCTVDVKFRTNIDDDQYNINARLLLAESQVGWREREAHLLDQICPPLFFSPQGRLPPSISIQDWS